MSSHNLIATMRSGALVRLLYADLDGALEALAMFADQLKKHPHDRAGCHIATQDVANSDGVGSAPICAVDYREVAAVHYAEST